MPIPLALLAAIPGAVQAGLGIAQSIKAKKFREQFERPTFQTPESIDRLVASARSGATQTELPGQRLTEERLAGSTAAGARALREATDSPAVAAANVANLFGKQNEALVDLRIAAAENQERNRRNLEEKFGIAADFEVKEFELNKLNPFIDAARASRELSAAGIQNLFGGVQSAGGGAFTTFQNQQFLNTLRRPTQGLTPQTTLPTGTTIQQDLIS